MPEQFHDFFQPDLGLTYHQFMAGLRHDDPVYRSPQLLGVVVTRHADVVGALRNTTLRPANSGGRLKLLPVEQQANLGPLMASLGRWVTNGGAETHKRLQSVLNRYFTSSRVESLRPVAQATLDRLLDQISLDDVEVVSELTYPLPAAVIAHMLGVPSGHEGRIQAWSKHITAIFVHHDYERLLDSQRAVIEMSDFLRPILAERRKEPGDDILSVLAGAQAEGKVLDDEEILANCCLLLFAGHETTGGLLAHGLATLIENPDQLAKLREQPSLRGNAVEEVLRCEGPAGAVIRSSASPLEIGGTAIAAGEPIYLCLSSANRDETVFEDPDRFDIERSNVRKNLAFGTGLSYCLGAALARLEADVFFETILRRFSNIEALEPASWTVVPPMYRSLPRFRVRLTE